MVAICGDDGCQAPRPIEADWKSLFTWGSPDDLVLLQAPGQFFIAYTMWSQQSCEVIFEVAAVGADPGAIGPTPGASLEVVFTDSATEFGPLFAGSVIEEGRAVVVYLSDQSIRSIHLPSDLPDSSTVPAALSDACESP